MKEFYSIINAGLVCGFILLYNIQECERPPITRLLATCNRYNCEPTHESQLLFHVVEFNWYVG